MTKVLIIPSWYPSRLSPISGIFFKDQAEALFHEGLDVSVFYSLVQPSFNPYLVIQKPKLFKESESKVSTYYAEGFSLPKRGFHLMDLWARKHYKLFEEYMEKEGKPDLIHAHSIIAGYLSMKLSEQYDIPYVITEHLHSFLEQKPNRRYLNISKPVFNNARLLIGVSNTMTVELNTLTDTETICIPNSVDKNLFYAKVIRKVDNNINLLCVARFTENKNIIALISAYALLLEENSSIQFNLCIAGSGNSNQISKVHSFAKKMEVFDKIEWIPRLTRDKIGNRMRSSDIFILPSKYETFGVVLIESIACGTPVICSAKGGPKDIINDNNGIFVEDATSKDLAKAIMSMSKNLESYSSQDISENIFKLYGSQTVSKSTICIYKKTIEDNNR